MSLLENVTQNTLFSTRRGFYLVILEPAYPHIVRSRSGFLPFRDSRLPSYSRRYALLQSRGGFLPRRNEREVLCRDLDVTVPIP